MNRLEEEKKKRCQLDNDVFSELIKREFLTSKITETPNKFDIIDMCLTGCTATKQMTYDIEIKSRDCEIGTYKDAVIEVTKYNALYCDGCTNERKIYAVIYYLDNLICVWNLDKLTSKKETNYCMNKTTYSDNKEKVMKANYNLSFDDAKFFTFECRHLYN